MARLPHFIIGTRGSPLALAQARLVQEELKIHSAQTIRIQTIRTSGDTAAPSVDSTGKGLFTKEIETALLDGVVDCAVHSLKDLPIELPHGLEFHASPAREDPRDVLISRDHLSLLSLPKGSCIGTASLRRQAQVLARRPDLQVRPIRGNIGTRLAKIGGGQFDAIILAAAGLKRLGMEMEVTEYFPPDTLLPACGQGALAIEVRADDHDTQALVARINHLPTWRAVVAERAFMRRLGASCRVPVAAYAEEREEKLFLRCLVADDQGKAVIAMDGSKELSAGEQLGEELAEACIQKGAARLLGQTPKR